MFISKVKNNNLDKALKDIKKKMFESKVLIELNERQAYLSKGERRRKCLQEAKRREKYKHESN